MSDEQNLIEMMKEQHKSVEDTCTNLEGLIRKLSGVMQVLGAAEYERFTTPISGPFAMLSEIHTELHNIAHLMEIECNKLVNESSHPVTVAEDSDKDE